ncbi:uncharacterized protein LOC130657158 [Hydractinia symbiolongicarpus]|uniref:uncharacterized protein LOC130657158 n=1 Tax=Hydractinia symbiolongicarpus TaxID=13093 RepID=UPI00254C4EDB|nr:uncharacterized protein LOC130657158 [Hydractinia symbiolongicarpus]
MGRISSVVYIILISVLPCVAYITRLPCKRNGNFTVIKTDIRYSGTVQETHADVTARDCALLCISHDTCTYFNHKVDNTSCELLAIDSGTQQSGHGWKFYSTNYGTPNRGPVCRSLSPCPMTSACVDICESPGYQCIANKFQGLYGSPYASPGYSSYPASQLTDGSYGTMAGTSSSVDAFISLNLGSEKLIRFVTLMMYSTNDRFEISIGNVNAKYGNEFCSLLPPYSGVEMLVECDNYLSGQYVVLYHMGGSSSSMYAYDMKAYVDV